MDTTRFQAFRVAIFQTFSRNKAVHMNIIDAILSYPEARHAIEFTLAPAFMRRWPSFYQALQEGGIDHDQLCRVFCQYVPLPGSAADPFLLPVDVTPILRPDSPTARDRLTVHVANLPDEEKPIGVGWQFSLVTAVSPLPSSWAYDLECSRLTTETTAAELAIAQLTHVLPQLPKRSARPLMLGDRYYGSAAFLLGARTLEADKLVRIQTHRVFYRPPPEPDPHRQGRRPTKGARFQPKDPTTHGTPTATWTGTDQRGRTVTVTAWDHLAFAKGMTHPFTVVRSVRQDSQPDTRKNPRVVWLIWDSYRKETATESVPPTPAPLPKIADYYAARFSIEHSFRFKKQNLLWAEPRLRTPEQFERWSDLIAAANNSLFLARELQICRRLPWEQSPARSPTPQQVRRALAHELPQLGTPASPPKPRGKAPGRTPGAHVKPAERYPIVRKSQGHSSTHSSRPDNTPSQQTKKRRAKSTKKPSLTACQLVSLIMLSILVMLSTPVPPTQLARKARKQSSEANSLSQNRSPVVRKRRTPFATGPPVTA
jgi:hypothetical protein